MCCANSAAWRLLAAVKPKWNCFREKSTIRSSSSRAVTCRYTGLSSTMKTYLIWFVHEHVEFRHPELQSLIELLGAELEFPDRKLDGRRLWMVDTRSIVRICHYRFLAAVLVLPVETRHSHIHQFLTVKFQFQFARFFSAVKSTLSCHG